MHAAAFAALLLASAVSVHAQTPNAPKYKCETVKLEATKGFCKGKVSFSQKMCVPAALSSADEWGSMMSNSLDVMDGSFCEGWTSVDLLEESCSTLGGTENKDFCWNGGMCNMSAAGLKSQECSSDSDCPVQGAGYKMCCSTLKYMYNDLCNGPDPAKIEEIISIQKEAGACTDTGDCAIKKTNVVSKFKEVGNCTDTGDCLTSTSSKCACAALLSSLTAFIVLVYSASY
jgi:hypothetical protein